mmetsp:Transcript_136671/g.237687  ORF Transcript_136671/g.237687 Transcript_136671/m.237687 type:complete len:100 (-) Transcript_136671:1700-1999(-)
MMMYSCSRRTRIVNSHGKLPINRVMSKAPVTSSAVRSSRCRSKFLAAEGKLDLPQAAWQRPRRGCGAWLKLICAGNARLPFLVYAGESNEPQTDLIALG